MVMYRGKARHTKPENPFWRNIERLFGRISEMRFQQKDIPLNASECDFIIDLFRRGQNYRMSQKQIRWFQAIERKLN